MLESIFTKDRRDTFMQSENFMMTSGSSSSDSIGE